jgi:hypothetical protein
MRSAINLSQHREIFSGQISREFSAANGSVAHHAIASGLEANWMQDQESELIDTAAADKTEG